MIIHKFHLNSTKVGAAKIKEFMLANNLEELGLGELNSLEVDRAAAGDRDGLLDLKLGDDLVATLRGNAEAILVLSRILKENKIESFPLADLHISNVNDFINGNRADLLTIEMANIQPGEELPTGHVK